MKWLPKWPLVFVGLALAACNNSTGCDYFADMAREERALIAECASTPGCRVEMYYIRAAKHHEKLAASCKVPE